MTTTFTELGLSDRMAHRLSTLGYAEPTPIQAQAIPLLLAKSDLLGIAKTGTGKTAAFSLPLVQHLTKSDTRAPRGGVSALVLAPTRELVIQIVDSVRGYAHKGGPRVAAVMGGVGKQPQINALQRGVEILVATPGRLLDLMNMGRVNLDATSYLVIDEADRMFDMGFIRDVRKIVASLPSERQTALFSATMPAEIAKLAGQILRDPERVEIKAATVTVDRIHQSVHHLAGGAEKRDRLRQLVSEPGADRVIVFTRTKRGADRVAKNLSRDGVSAEILHGNKTQGARKRALDNFRGGKSRILVATDIASRGIDVENVTHVINYELPDVAEDYVHRIGRTARAGTSGVAVSFCDATERSKLKSIERQIRQSMVVVGETPAWQPRLDAEGKGGGDAANGKKPKNRRRRPSRSRRKAGQGGRSRAADRQAANA